MYGAASALRKYTVAALPWGASWSNLSTAPKTPKTSPGADKRIVKIVVIDLLREVDQARRQDAEVEHAVAVVSRSCQHRISGLVFVTCARTISNPAN